MRPAQAQTRSIRIYGIEIIRRAAEAAHEFHAITRFMGPEKSAIQIEEILFPLLQDLATTNVHGHVIGIAAIGSPVAFNDALVVALGVTGTETAFIVPAIFIVAAGQEACPHKAILTITTRTVIEVGRVITVAVFDERHESQRAMQAL